MKSLTTRAKYSMIREGECFIFSVKEKRAFCKIRIANITEKAAKRFLRFISEGDVSACHLTSVAEDKAVESVTEIFSELL